MENTNKREPKYWDKHLSQCHYLHHKFHMDWAGSELGTRLWRAGDQPHEPWYSPSVTLKLHPQDWYIWKMHKHLHKVQGVQYASTLFPWLVYWANIHIQVHLPKNSHLATWPTEWYWLSARHLHVCQAQTHHGNEQQVSTSHGNKHWWFLRHVSHSMTISGKQTSVPLPQHGRQPQVTNVCQIPQSWEHSFTVHKTRFRNANWDSLIATRLIKETNFIILSGL